MRIFYFIITLVLCAMTGCGNKNTQESLPKTAIWHVDTTFVADSAKSASFTMQFSMEFPEFSESFTQEMALSILQQTTGLDSLEDPKIIMDKYKQYWVSYYEKAIRDITITADTMFMSPDFFEWYYSVKGSVFCMTKDVVCFKITTDSKFGEMTQSESYVNISKDKGLLGLDDIFSEGYEDILSEMIVDQLVRDYNLKSEKDLESIGFFDISDISPSHNFAVGDDGITFIYNKGEISANVLGVVSPFISYSELEDIIKE